MGCKEEPVVPLANNQNVPPADPNRIPSLREVPKDQQGLVQVSDFLEGLIQETNLGWSSPEPADMVWYTDDDDLLEFEGLAIAVEGVSDEEAGQVADFFGDYEASEMNTGDGGGGSAIGYVIEDDLVCYEVLMWANIEMGEELSEDEPVEFNLEVVCGILP